MCFLSCLPFSDIRPHNCRISRMQLSLYLPSEHIQIKWQEEPSEHRVTFPTFYVDTSWLEPLTLTPELASRILLRASVRASSKPPPASSPPPSGCPPPPPPPPPASSWRQRGPCPRWQRRGSFHMRGWRGTGWRRARGLTSSPAVKASSAPSSSTASPPSIPLSPINNTSIKVTTSWSSDNARHALHHRTKKAIIIQIDMSPKSGNGLWYLISSVTNSSRNDVPV